MGAAVSHWPDRALARPLPDMSHFAAEFYEYCATLAGAF